YVGESGRTNRAGYEQLRAIVEPLGCAIQPVPVRGCLHLKSAVTALDAETVLLQPAWVDPSAFEDLRHLGVDPAEPFAANALRVRDVVLYATSHPRTAERIAALGFDVRLVDVSELAKAEGALTCCSVLI